MISPLEAGVTESRKDSRKIGDTQHSYFLSTSAFMPVCSERCSYSLEPLWGLSPSLSAAWVTKNGEDMNGGERGPKLRSCHWGMQSISYVVEGYIFSPATS